MDNLAPGRNDECWCGSGKKYKKCHLEFDRHLQEHDAGEIVLGRDRLKTPEEIEGIKASAGVNIGALDYVAEHIGAKGRAPRKSTAGFTTTASSMGRFRRPRLRGVSQERVHLDKRSRFAMASPSEDDVLKSGDIVNVDMSTIPMGISRIRRACSGHR